MMQRISFSVLILLSCLSIISVNTPVLALNCANPASTKEAIECGSCDAANQKDCSSGASTKSLNTTIKSIINILSVTVGVVAVIMIIISGFRYITSGGASDKVTSAKNTLLYAIIGLIIVALAQIIVHFVINKLE